MSFTRKSFRFILLSMSLLMVFVMGSFSQEIVSKASEYADDHPDKRGASSEGKREFGGSAAVSRYSELINGTTYVFSSATGVELEDMSSDTTQLVAAGSDDGNSVLQSIGFDFWYDGVRFTQFGANANGFIRLGLAPTGGSFNNATGFATTTNAPKIAPFFDDLCVGTNGKVHYKTVGTSPNRKLVVEYQNMQITRGAGCSGPGGGTFQLWLYESTGTTSPGVIQFVYGEGIGASAPADGGASIGLQSGAAANFASVTAASDTVSYTVHDALNATGVPAGKSYIFTPNLPGTPSGLNFTGVTGSTITLNWTDNSSNESGFVIYRSLDGVDYDFLAQVAADTTSYENTLLEPGTNYFYQVAAFSEGAVSASISGSQATNPPGNIACNGAGGDWSDTATWKGGSLPTSTDNVTIGTGCTVTVDFANAAALNVTIDSGGTLQSPLSGTVTDNNLTVSGDLTNNGTLDLSTNDNTSGAILTFGIGSTNSVFGGTGAVTDVRAITIAKGAQASVVELNPDNFTVRGVNTDSAGFLTITSGTFKISGNFTATNRVFTAAAYTIPALGGFWLDNPNFTVAGQNGSAAVSGLFRITQGTYNIGTSTGNSMSFAANSTINVEGGSINAAGRFGVTAAATIINYTQSGGTITVQTIGNASATLAGFDLGTSTNSSINISGGTIIVQLPSTGTTQIDYRNQSGSGFTGTANATLQLGNASSGAAKSFLIRGVVPNLVIDNTSAGHSAAWFATATTYNNISRNITVNPGTTLNFANNVFLFAGETLTNNGTIIHNGASSRFITFLTDAPQTYTGSGTVTAPMTSFEFQSDMGFTFDSSVSPIVTNRVINFIGNVTNSNKLTVGNGGTTTAVVQIGNTTTPTAAGVFDSQLGFNPGSGGINMSYLRTTLPRVTGGEIPATRTINNLNYDNNDSTHTLTIDGGNLTSNGTLALTNGVISTGSNTLIHNGTVTRTNGYVDGNLSRNFAATGAYTYHVGQGGYSPVATSITAGDLPQSLTVSAVQGVHPNIPNAALALGRHWSLTGSDLTADLTFNYLDPADIPETATEADFVIMKYDGSFTSPGGTVNAGANTASITGVTSFSDWTLAEPGALSNPGEFELSSENYSVAEDGGSVTITVNRTGGSDGTATVDYATVAGGSATGGAACDPGVDYVNSSGTLSFGDGVTSQTFSITICDDSDVESDETVNMALSNPTGGSTLGTPNTAVLTITDNDAATGNVTVNPGNVSYETLGEAVAAINAGTHTGAVTVDINADTAETGSIVLHGSGAGTASYTSIIIRPAADNVTVAGASAQGRGLIELNGADNVTIDGDNPNTAGTNRDLTIQNTAGNTTTFTSVIRIALNITTVTSADNNIFRNLNIVGSSTGRNIVGATAVGASENTTFGIFAGPNASGETTAPTTVTSVLTGVAAGASAADLLIENNSFATTARAISLNGTATTVFAGLEVRNNDIGNIVAGDPDQVTAIGITVNGSAGAIIADNTVYVEGWIASSAAGHGINVGVNSTQTTGAIIERNRVNRVRNNNPASWSAFGINLTGIAGSAHTVRNNFVSNIMNSQVSGTAAFGTTFGAYGIRVASGTGHKIYHNSVHLYGEMPGIISTNLTAAFLIVGTGQTGVDVRNNIFSNQITGGNPTGTRNTVIYLPPSATPTMDLTLNNNDYFQSNDPLSTMAQVGSAFATSVAYMAADFDPSTTTPSTNFRAYTSGLNAAGTNDNASTTVDPQFIADTDLHIFPTSLMESSGTDVGVADDIDGDPRSAVPDIGADEISVSGPGTIQFNSTGFSGNEGSTVTINVIRSGGVDGTVGATATVTDGTAVGGASCGAGVDYINPGTQTLSFGDGVALQTFTIELCSDSTLEPAETVNLTLSDPTGGATLGTNNPATLTINDVPPPMAGTISVGTGEIFTSLTNAGGIFEAINEAGLSDDLTINITSDLTAETGAVMLNQFTETGGGGYSLTIKPSGGPRVISGTAPANIGLITLNGVDRVTIDGSLTEGGTDRNLTIINNQTGTSTVIWLRSQSAANGANDNTIKNSVIHGASTGTAQTTAGILAGSGVTIGGAAEAPNNNNTVTNNWIYKVQNSIYNQGNAGFDQNWVITDNDFGSATAGDQNAFRGMLMGNTTNFVIANNTVLGVASFPSTAAAMSGIQLAFGVSNGIVVGNHISNVVNSSASGTGAFGIQLSATPVTNVTIANNMISGMSATGSATVTNNGHGITVNSATALGAGAYNIYFNTINIGINQATGTTAALNVVASVGTAGALNVRNNIFANTQTTGATRYAVYSAAGAGIFSTINYNNYYSSGSVGFLGGARATLADWQTATGQDANSLAVDPMFISASDLHLQSGSPMVNAGTPIAGITTDIDGDTRSETTPDIGADEIEGSGPSEASLGGRVITAAGRGIPNARIEITGGGLTEPVKAFTNTFGYYRVDGLPTGQSYTVTVSERRYVFADPVVVVTLNASVSNIDFIASP